MINDNWIKEEAVSKLAEFIFKSRGLESLNISDSDMGSSNVALIVWALSDSPSVSTLKRFQCNYNEVESRTVAKEVLKMLVTKFPALESVEFIDNNFSKKFRKEVIGKMEEEGSNVKWIL
jgi:Ran GTPase-activating protein (RanGAP) involved in mRNA processing and transport